MGKKIFAVLLLLSFACAGLQAQNKNNKDSKKDTRGRYNEDAALLNLASVRTSTDSISRSQVVLDLTKKDDGVVSVATILSTYTPFILPSLDELFQRVKNNPSVLYRQHEVDYAWRDVESARMDWLKWFHGDAAYSYGRYNSNLYYQQTNIPTANSYSNQNSSYYLFGGGITINLYDVVNLNNKIKQQKDRYYATQYQYESEYEQLLEKVNKSYYIILGSVPMLTHSIQWAKLAELAYADAKLDFINGRAGTNTLFECETQYYRSTQELTAMIRDINTEVKFLELVTNSKIIPDNGDNTVNTGGQSLSTDTSSVQVPSNSSSDKKSKGTKRNRKNKK
jgi:outer membrane protein TolC